MRILRAGLIFAISLVVTLLAGSGSASATTVCVAGVYDITYAGVSNVSPGAHISKAWRISLCGGGWIYAEAVKDGGDFGPSRLGIPRISGRGSVDMWTPFYAPAALGRHSAAYRIEVDGVRVGPVFSLEINSVLFTPFAPSSSWTLTQGDHPVWQANDGFNGKAHDFAPNFGSCTAGVNTAAAVLPVAPGTVIAVDAATAYVAVAHANGLIGVYEHVHPIAVSLGQGVTATTKLGSPSMFGGTATGCHVHVGFATYSGSAPLPGTFNPNRATWLRTFPLLVSR